MQHFDQEYDVVGIDNDMRAYFFGKEASTHWATQKLISEIPNFKLYLNDIRDEKEVNHIFSK